ncbi:hypothetical protein SLE2022_322310 [Rubroshorea leprosula]
MEQRENRGGYQQDAELPTKEPQSIFLLLPCVARLLGIFLGQFGIKTRIERTQSGDYHLIFGNPDINHLISTGRI